MANLFGIHSVGMSLMAYPRNAYRQTFDDTQPCSFDVVSSGQQEEMSVTGNVATLYL